MVVIFWVLIQITRCKNSQLQIHLIFNGFTSFGSQIDLILTPTKLVPAPEESGRLSGANYYGCRFSVKERVKIMLELNNNIKYT